MAERNPPLYLAGGSHPANLFRLFTADLIPTEGVLDLDGGHLQVTERAAGANMSVDVAAGSAIIAGDQSNAQGSYHVTNDATVNLAIAAADATNPRIDRVIARVSDVEYDAGASDTWALEVLTGTPASSPAAPALPDDALDLALVDVPAGDTSITNAQITDQRSSAALSRALNRDHPHAEIARAATQTVTAGANTTISFDTAVKDEHGWWASGNPSRITPDVAGRYQGVLLVDAPQSWNGDRMRVVLTKNGSGTAWEIDGQGPAASQGKTVQVTGEVDVNGTGDWLGGLVFNGHTGDRVITARIAVRRVAV